MPAARERLRHDYGSFVELGLELSCPEAARLILETPLRWDTETVPGDGEPEYDGEIMALLQQSRPIALALLADGRYSVPERLRLLLMYGYHVQAAIDGAEPVPFDPAAALKEAAQSKITFSEGLRTIRDFAFEECFDLTELDIPSSVKFVESEAFYNCSSLHIIRYKGKEYTVNEFLGLFN